MINYRFMVFIKINKQTHNTRNTLPFKSFGLIRYINAYQDWIYLIKNIIMLLDVLLQFKIYVSIWLDFKIYCWQSWFFSIITPVFSVTWSFRNHSNMMICCSRNISLYYQCWKQLLKGLVHFWKKLLLIIYSPPCHPRCPCLSFLSRKEI